VRVHAWIRAKNEAAIIGYTVRYLLEAGVDRVFVLDTGSEDGTADVAKSAGAETLTLRLSFYHEPLERMIALSIARLGEPDIIVQLDADEYIEGPLLEALKETLAQRQKHTWTIRLYDFRFCEEHPEEAAILAPLLPNRRWAEPFFRRIPRVYRPRPELQFLPFQPHHSACVAVQPRTLGHIEACVIRHYGLCRSAAEFEVKRQRYTVQHAGRAYSAEWQEAHCFIPQAHLREWPLDAPPPADAIEVHLGSNVAKRDLHDRSHIVGVY